jgi:hypothetical protein
MNVEIGTGTPIFLLWEYLFRKFGILSFQCTYMMENIHLSKISINAKITLCTVEVYLSVKWPKGCDSL